MREDRTAARVFTSLTFAIVVAIALLVAACVYAAATIDTAAQFSGALAVGIASGAGGCWVGTVARIRRRRRP